MPIGEPDKVRLDRWLWSVRIFKSRNLATEACKKNWVKLDGHPAKPSKEIKMGDVITIKLGPLQKIVSVVGLIEKRSKNTIFVLHIYEVCISRLEILCKSWRY